MMADANLFQQYLRPPKSVSDYTAEMDVADSRRLANENQRGQNALLTLSRQQQVDTARTAADDRNALTRFAGQAGGNKNKLIEMLEASGRPALLQQADTLRKSVLDQQKVEAEVGDKNAGTATKQYELRMKKREQALQDIAALSSPEEAAAAVRAHLAAGDLDETKAQAVLGTLPKDPAQFSAWQVSMLKNILSAKDRLDVDDKAAGRAREDRNALIGPDGKPNLPVIAAKKDIARAGSSNVSVNTGQKGLDNTLKLRGDFRSEPVYKAHQEMQSAYAQIQQSLGQASPAGDLAGATKIMKLLDPGSVVRESELGMAMAASGLLDRVQNYAQNIVNGTKLTPTQRADFLRLANALYGESVKQYNSKRGEYEGIANRNALPVADVVGGASAAPGAAAPPPGGGEVNFADLK